MRTMRLLSNALLAGLLVAPAAAADFLDDFDSGIDPARWSEVHQVALTQGSVLLHPGGPIGISGFDTPGLLSVQRFENARVEFDFNGMVVRRLLLAQGDPVYQSSFAVHLRRTPESFYEVLVLPYGPDRIAATQVLVIINRVVGFAFAGYAARFTAPLAAPLEFDRTVRVAITLSGATFRVQLGDVLDVSATDPSVPLPAGSLGPFTGNALIPWRCDNFAVTDFGS